MKECELSLDELFHQVSDKSVLIHESAFQFKEKFQRAKDLECHRSFTEECAHRTL